VSLLAGYFNTIFDIFWKSQQTECLLAETRLLPPSCVVCFDPLIFWGRGRFWVLVSSVIDSATKVAIDSPICQDHK